MNIGILGAGTWGVSLAQSLSENYNVLVWHYKRSFVSKINATRLHPILSKNKIDPKIRFSDSNKFLIKCKIIIVAVPSNKIREVLEKVKLNDSSIIVCASKGIEIETGKLSSDIIAEMLKIKKEHIVILSGPSHAEELFLKMPTTAVVSCTNINQARYIQKIISNYYFRVYANSDIIGVQIGGSAKNVIAIASGICKGLGYGDNTIAALLTRGLSEIIELGISLGAKSETFSGLSGLGDLIVTAYSSHSRNNMVGNLIAKGLTLKQIKKKMNMIAEGINTTKSIYLLSKKLDIQMPICNKVYQVIFENKLPSDAIAELMSRDLIDERL